MMQMSDAHGLGEIPSSALQSTNSSAGQPISRLAVTVAEGAQMLGVGRATLYRLVMRGEIESFTVGRARRIAVSALERYMRTAERGVA
jgi:excisionase family DNA binding protein